MRIKLTGRHGAMRPGAEWNCPWVHVAVGLIEAGKAVAVEPCDSHLNPTPEAVLKPAAKPAAAGRKRQR